MAILLVRRSVCHQICVLVQIEISCFLIPILACTSVSCISFVDGGVFDYVVRFVFIMFIGKTDIFHHIFSSAKPCKHAKTHALQRLSVFIRFSNAPDGL